MTPSYAVIYALRGTTGERREQIEKLSEKSNRLESVWKSIRDSDGLKSATAQAAYADYSAAVDALNIILVENS
jgi:hypothetical protein